MANARVNIKWDGPNFLKHVRKSAEDALFAGAAVAADYAARSFGRAHGGIPSLPGNPPNSQSGHLRNSITFVHAKDLGIPMAAAYGTNVPYGRYLEFGANPKGRPWLTIPVHPMAIQASRRGLSARSFPLRFVKTKNQALLVKDVPGRHARMEVWYVLKHEVHIAPRPWLRRSLYEARPRIEKAVHTTFRKRMEQYRGVQRGK